MRHPDHPFEVIDTAHKAKCITNCSFDLVFKLRCQSIVPRAQGLIHYFKKMVYSSNLKLLSLPLTSFQNGRHFDDIILIVKVVKSVYFLMFLTKGHL